MDCPKFVDAAHSSIADGIAVIIHVDPLTAADMSSGVGRNPNLMCFDELCFWGQLKVELSGFARLRGGIEDRCLDGSIDNESDFVNANCKAIGGIMAGGIGLNNPGKITSVSCFNPDIGAFDGFPAGSFTTPSKADVPAQALKATRNKPTKLILYDLRNIWASYGFWLTNRGLSNTKTVTVPLVAPLLECGSAGTRTRNQRLKGRLIRAKYGSSIDERR